MVDGKLFLFNENQVESIFLYFQIIFIEQRLERIDFESTIGFRLVQKEKKRQSNSFVSNLQTTRKLMSDSISTNFIEDCLSKLIT